jgi:hypothetical protein
VVEVVLLDPINVIPDGIAVAVAVVVAVWVGAI